MFVVSKQENLMHDASQGAISLGAGRSLIGKAPLTRDTTSQTLYEQNASILNNVALMINVAEEMVLVVGTVIVLQQSQDITYGAGIICKCAPNTLPLLSDLGPA